MSHRLQVRPQAETDIEEAYTWYEQQAPGLGEEFVRTVDAALATVQRNPGAHAPVHGQVRRILLRRFPYGVFHVLQEDEIVVLACMHTSRNPSQWQSRS